jgi:predicted tellurium resistance membrane protein TerC
MKITLTWTNVEMKRNKSKATRKRDRKRHEQYIEQKKVTENNKETEIKETNTKILYIVLLQCSLSIIMFWGDDPFVQAIALRRKSGSRPDPQRRVKSKHTR